MIKSLEYVRNQIIKLKDDLQHYTMVEKDSALASQIRYDLEQFENIERELKDLEFLKELFKSIIIMKENGLPIVELKCNEETMKKLREVLKGDIK